MWWRKFWRRQSRNSRLVRALIAVAVVGITLVLSNTGYATVCAFIDAEGASLAIESVTIDGVAEPNLSPWARRLSGVFGADGGARISSSGGSPFSTVAFEQAPTADGGVVDANR